VSQPSHGTGHRKFHKPMAPSVGVAYRLNSVSVLQDPLPVQWLLMPVPFTQL
jgi:hypothetical protein